MLSEIIPVFERKDDRLMFLNAKYPSQDSLRKACVAQSRERTDGNLLITVRSFMVSLENVRKFIFFS